MSDGNGGAVKLFLVVRSDIIPAQQAVQAAHALQEFNVRHPELARSWHASSNTIALLEIDDEPALEALLSKAAAVGVPFAEFREPDMGDQLTAAALEHAAKKLCRRLRCALSG